MSKFGVRYGPWALVAGASDGIGEWFARASAEAGLNVVLLARREALLRSVAKDLAERYGVETRTLVADLTSDDLGARVEAATRDLEVGLLVYNAGATHGAKKFHDHPVENALGLVDLNCRGPVLLAHHLGGRMRARGRGGIVLMTSMACFSGSAYIATYAATKAFDRILAESLWHELQPHGVDVLSVVAGATRTPAVLRSSDKFESYPGLMEPEDVARGALAFLGKGPVWVAGDANRALAKGLSPVARVPIINAMSQATASLYDMPYSEVAGEE